jgi:hypothetical protein
VCDDIASPGNIDGMGNLRWAYTRNIRGEDLGFQYPLLGSVDNVDAEQCHEASKDLTKQERLAHVSDQSHDDLKNIAFK